MAQNRALIIGVDAETDRQGEIRDCARDARCFTAALTDILEFDPVDVRLLVNRHASRGGVIAALHWLLADALEGDARVLYFSGLGHRVPSNGLLREVLVLHNGDYLFDNDIAFPCSKLPPRVMTTVLDTCFDGGLDQRFGAPELGVVKAWRPRFNKLELLQFRERFAGVSSFAPFGCAPYICSRQQLADMQLGLPHSELTPMPTINAALIKACQEHEVAISGRDTLEELSAFTFALCQFLDKRGGPVSGKCAIEGAASELAALGVGQTPQYIYPDNWGEPSDLGFLTHAALPETTEASEVPSTLQMAMPASTGKSGCLQEFLRMLPPSSAQSFVSGGRASMAAVRRQFTDGSD